MLGHKTIDLWKLRTCFFIWYIIVQGLDRYLMSYFTENILISPKDVHISVYQYFFRFRRN